MTVTKTKKKATKAEQPAAPPSPLVPAEVLGVVERGSKGMRGRWTILRREGWARFYCKACAAAPMMTLRRRELGDHVFARFETSKRKITKVRVRCWCSARLALLLPKLVPEAQRDTLEKA